MKQLTNILIVLGIITLATSCIDPYTPPFINNEKTYLVVNAFMDSEKGVGYVILTKTILLSQPNSSPKEERAKVTLEIQNGVSYPFVETSPGNYAISGIDLKNQSCRIRIKTTDNREFLSDYATPKKTPDIDSVTYEVNETEGLKISVTTHDSEKKTKFYRWRYEQTSQYTSEFESTIYYDPIRKEVFKRDTEDLRIFTCWKTEASGDLMIASSKNLNQDVIDKFPIVTLPLSSWRYKLKYSILVKQYAIDEAEYNYWNELKKNTENIGTIFDPQPSMVSGNLHCLTADEPVLGYFSLSTQKEKRIFINGRTLPYYYYTTPYEGLCESFSDTIYLNDFMKSPMSQLIIKGVYTLTGDLIGYETTKSTCIDCRTLVGGSNLKPDFWE